MTRVRPCGVRHLTTRNTAAAALACLVLLSCSTANDDGVLPDAGTSSGRDSTTSTTSTTSSPESTGSDTIAAVGDASTTVAGEATSDANQEIVDRYIGYWQARFDANTGVPNPDDPQLAEFATGRQLEQVRSETQANFDEGLAFRAAADPANFQRVAVVSVDGDHAVVQECVVSDDVVFRRDSGEVVDDTVATHNARGEMTRVGGVWRVSAVSMVQKWTGVAGCALAS